MESQRTTRLVAKGMSRPTNDKPIHKKDDAIDTTCNACNHKIDEIKTTKVRSSEEMFRNNSLEELHQLEEAEEETKRREAYQKRKANRMVHSSDKLYLSRRLINTIECSSPKSPIECIQLSKQFTNSKSKIRKITRDTRKYRIQICFK
jgi:hypothetical protein